MCRIHAKSKPCLLGFVITWNIVLGVASKVGDVESLLWELVDLS